MNTKIIILSILIPVLLPTGCAAMYPKAPAPKASAKKVISHKLTPKTVKRTAAPAQQQPVSQQAAEEQFKKDMAKALALSKQSQPKQKTATSSTAAPRPASHLSLSPEEMLYQQAIAASLKTAPQKLMPPTSAQQAERDLQAAIAASREEFGYSATIPAKVPAKTRIHLAPIHLNTNRQSGLECGFRAVTNARALENLITKGKAITEPSLKAEELAIYNKNKAVGITQNLTIDNVGIRAQRLGLPNLYPLGFNKALFTIYSPGNGEISINDAFQLFAHDNYRTLHFVINTGGHWVLLTLIKKSPNNFTLFHVDSMNSRPGAMVQPYVDYINQQLSAINL
jgi:hypothetical protein